MKVLAIVLLFAALSHAANLDRNRELCPDVTCPPLNPDPPAEAILKPHPTDCSKFCMCDWGEPVLFDCPAGLFFNTEADPGPVCDWPENVARCSGSQETDAPPAETDAPPPASACEQLNSFCPAENPAPPAWGTYLPHPETCAKFCQCDWGVAIEKDCPEGTAFNPDATPGPVCDWPENVKGCGGDGGSNGGGGNGNGGGGNGGNGDSECANVDCPATNPDPPAWADYRPHPSDCTKFCECNWGVGVEFDCPAGLHWNSELNTCDWPANAGCSSGGNNNQETTVAEEVQMECTQGVRSQSGRDICFDLIPLDPISSYDNAKDKCAALGGLPASIRNLDEQNAINTLTAGVTGNCKRGTFFAFIGLRRSAFPLHLSADGFDQWEDGFPFSFVEPPSFPSNSFSNWNRAMRFFTPDEPDNTGFVENNVALTGLTENAAMGGVGVRGTWFTIPEYLRPFTCSGSGDAYVVCQFQPTEVVEEDPTTPAPAPATSCADISSQCSPTNPDPPAWAQYLAHPTDCTKFCQCNWGEAIEMDCPAGLWFDMEAEPGPVCNWPQFTNCNNARR